MDKHENAYVREGRGALCPHLDIAEPGGNQRWDPAIARWAR